MARFNDIFPDPDTLLRLEAEDVGVLLLQYLNALPDGGQLFNRHNLFTPDGDLMKYAGAKQLEVSKAVMEGWVWLEHERLVAPAPDDSTLHNYFVTRRGQNLRNQTDYSAFKRGTLLAAGSLDAVLAHKVVHLFTRGDYDAAIFQAYKEVEVRVRTACAKKGQPVGDDTVGTKLMSRAFDPTQGVLSNNQIVSAEREATRNVFAGAIGLFKNPSSHRDVKLAALEASELIHFANHLLRVVDSASVAT
jgi:uncharacterized protein (TIGR02391 family)